MPDKSYVCVLCGHEFTSADKPKRCPECLSATGLQELADAPKPSGGAAKSSGGGRKTGPIAVVVAVVAIVTAAVAWYFVTRPSEPEPSAALRPGGVEAPAVDVDKAPDPALAGPEVKAYVQAHLAGADAAGLAAHFAKLASDGAIKPWDPDHELGRAPMTAEDLARALADASPDVTVGFEVAVTAAAMARALGLEAMVVEEKDVPDTATSPLRKRFLARVAGVDIDPWAEGGRAAEGKRVALSSDELRAFHQAHVSLSAAETGDFKAATAAIQRAMKLAPEQPALQFLKGQVTILSGMVQFGIEDMEKAIAVAEDALGRYNLGVAYVQAQRFFKAHQSLRRAIELDPKFVGAWLALASLQLARLPISPEEERAGLVAAAREAVEKARSIDPEADGVAAVAAQIMLATDDERGAFTVLDEAVRVHPERAQPYLLLASLLANQGKWAELVAYMKRGLSHNPDDPQLRRMLVMGYISQGRLKEAAQVLSEALERNPEAPDVRVELAGLLVELDDRSSARRLLEEELERFPDSDQAALLVAQLELEDGKAEAAIARLDAVLAKEAGRFEALVLRYIAALKTGRDSEAPGLLRRIAAAHENGRSFLAQLLLEQGMVEEGIAVLENVLSDRPDSVAEAVILIGAYTKLGRDADAAAARAKLLERTDNDPQLVQHLDMLQAEARRMREAEKAEPEPEPAAEPEPVPEPPAATAPASPMGGLPGKIEMPKIRMPSAPGEAPSGSGLPAPGLDLPDMPKLP